jgi:hypothetical protein
VTAVNDTAPVITSNGGGATAAITVAENSTAVTTVTATDADGGSTLSYSITGGADAGRFSIDSNTGVLTFMAAPDFESPADTGFDNQYDVIVRADNGAGGAVVQQLFVIVTNLNEAPVATADDLGSVNADSLIITSTTLLTNDIDVDDDALQIIAVTAPAHGTLVPDASGGWRYTPVAGYAGIDTFIYTVADASGLQATAQVTVLVAPLASPTNQSGTSTTPPAETAPPAEATPGVATNADTPAVEKLDQLPARNTLLPTIVGGHQYSTLDATATFVQKFLAQLQTPNHGSAAVIDVELKSAFDQLLGGQSSVVFNLFRSLAQFGTEADLQRSLTVLSEMFDDLSQAEAQSRREVGQAVVGTSFALGVGVVTWLLRGGALLAALMSTLPAWSGFDPVPVLSSQGKRRADDADADAEPTDTDAGEQAVVRIMRPGAMKSNVSAG